ncbi:HXXEE domain-containing protein [Streptomyces sp. RFCAC02]|uniref:HXXEE domain-containing protein n=1 Tax=Streptomyces sp. RFCAC02 TaxID=2499143 RepID=UPI0010205784|nr:HXXEE domain-containing protein [Streptomyces sp. RFCAC02]
MDGDARRRDGAGAAVTLGLLAAWAVHDLEEVVTVPRWTRTVAPGLRDRLPWVPDGVWRRLAATRRREFTAAVAVMAVLVAAAAADGYRTGGRSAAYRAALDGFGLHGAAHLAQAAVVRGYTPGSVTAPLVVVPFTLWARRELRRAGVPAPARPLDAVRGAALAAAATAGAHAAARRLTGGRGRPRRSGSVRRVLSRDRRDPPDRP